MALDIFLKLGDVKGGSVDAAHKDAIVVNAYSFGVSNTGSVGSAGSGAGAGKASFSDLTFTTPVSVASPKLMLACASGTHYDTAVLTVRRGAGGSGGAAQDFFRLTLKTVLVSSYQDAGSSGDGTPMDSITLAFAALKVDFVPQNGSGAAGQTTSAGWDRTKNQPYNG
ncbi:MAG TPA: type VI secretion system tube protein Hcp [Acidimicrobiia bacterium]|nr:type VI secretion system tube protein Hcp [Acidimicrobiia bacterium]